MRSHTPRAILARLIDTLLTPSGVIYKCETCGEYYDPSNTKAAYPHNNH